jgi:hypothetical protein
MDSSQSYITNVTAIELAQALIRRHDMMEYLKAVRRPKIENEPFKYIESRVRYCFENTGFGGSIMNLDDSRSVVVVDDAHDIGFY